MSLIVEHPIHGVGAIIRAVEGDTVRVEFANGRLFNLPFQSLRVLSVLAGDLQKRRTRAERAFIRKHSRVKAERVIQPSRGLPDETVSQRLVRRLFLGLIYRNKQEQLIAFKGLRTIARKAGQGLEEFLDPNTAAAETFMECLHGKRDPRYFGKVCREKMLMERRKQKAEKRGGKAVQIGIETRTQPAKIDRLLSKRAEKIFFGGKRKRPCFADK
jgi:hypothetical protein